MTKTDFDFDTWFETLSNQVLDRTDVEITDMDNVRADYEDGRDVFDVVDEIVAEYGGKT